MPVVLYIQKAANGVHKRQQTQLLRRKDRQAPAVAQRPEFRILFLISDAHTLSIPCLSKY